MKHLKYFNKNWTIYCDMDGVICDWNHRFETLVLNGFNREHGTNIKSGDEFENKMSKVTMEYRLALASSGFPKYPPTLKSGFSKWKGIILEATSKPKISLIASRRLPLPDVENCLRSSI